MATQHTFSRYTLEALLLLGQLVREARRERGWTVDELAERVGVSHVTIRKVERGDPTVALGTAFEAAGLLRVPLFHEDPARRRTERARSVDRLAVLPRPARLGSAEFDDDF